MAIYSVSNAQLQPESCITEGCWNVDFKTAEKAAECCMAKRGDNDKQAFVYKAIHELGAMVESSTGEHSPSRPSTRGRYQRISVHETMQSAQVAIQLQNAFSYVFMFNTGKRFHAKVYRCVDHRSCNRYFRVMEINGEDDRDSRCFAVEARGSHSITLKGQDQDGVFASTDGTYKLHYGGWVLVAFGTYQSHFTAEKKYSKSFVPWAYMFNNIKVNITQMHKTRTPAQFEAVSKKLCLQRWQADGQHEYAAWFEKIYLTDTWTRWYTTSGAPGALPNQNPLESHNAVIKTCGVTAKRAKTGVVLNDSIPGVFSLMSAASPTSAISHFSGDDTIHQAVRHTSSSMYYKKTKVVNRKRVPRSFLFNATEYMDTDTDPACEVTKVRVDRYLEAKVGKLRESDTVEDINIHYLCLHEVEILNHSDRAKTFQLQLHPVISMDNIREIRALFRCDCKMFWSTGKQFDLTVAKKNLPTTKLCGGQRKIAGALFIDAPDCRTFSIPSLEKKLTKKPHNPYGWQIAKDFAVVVNGEEEDISMIITIQAYSSRGGRYRWLVDFEGGKQVFLECQQLVQLIVESRRTGLDVTKDAAAHANTHESHPRSVDRDADDDQDLDS
ncbi:uncharacterized protein PITG_18663 [Phytophthora infestans T30-4]|uniref:Uncharacterized protein n=1 Tax=Phytophthora infestans (strain T30-4) TaxID=403677 RepID=D0NZA3_PHYIT|nr:uncharacterized protein PITG_18663 [Phytophthora infestans T30-4]EEY68912.1 conserved hypothetical protein [Phytophthora infestans T30-4]|eukprot:XP_002997298.1 conserved hypothetical protein [Phytophthora infestans T30-4]